MNRCLNLFAWVLLSIGLLFSTKTTKGLYSSNIPSNLQSSKDSLKLKIDSILKNSKPIMGYRFVVTGDFDGDKISDTLIERFTDSSFQVEMPKYYESSDTNFGYDQLIFLTENLKPKSFVEFKKYNLRLEGGHLGFHYIENCGDLNLDGKDEVLLVRQWCDFTNLNTAYIFTLNKNRWKAIFEIPVWEWQFPLTPMASMIPGMFGNFEYATSEEDSVNMDIEKELKAFRFFNYYQDLSIEFSGMNPLWEKFDSEKLGDDWEYYDSNFQGMINKLFEKTRINDSIYLKDRRNPSVFYKATELLDPNGNKYIEFPIDDPAWMMTTRIYLNHPKSPFRRGKTK